MTKTDVSVLNHETGRLVSTVPVLSRSSARKPRLSPTAAVALPGTTVTDATGAGEPTTCTVSVSLSPPHPRVRSRRSVDRDRRLAGVALARRAQQRAANLPGADNRRSRSTDL